MVEADRALKAKESALEEPIAHFTTSSQEAAKVMKDSLLLNQHSTLVQQSINRQAQQLNKLELDSTASQYQFTTSSQQKLMDMLQSGELS